MDVAGEIGMTDYHLSVDDDGKIQTGELLLEGTEEAIETFVAEIPDDALKEIARKFRDYLSKPYQGPSREDDK